MCWKCEDVRPYDPPPEGWGGGKSIPGPGYTRIFPDGSVWKPVEEHWDKFQGEGPEAPGWELLRIENPLKFVWGNFDSDHERVGQEFQASLDRWNSKRYFGRLEKIELSEVGIRVTRIQTRYNQYVEDRMPAISAEASHINLYDLIKIMQKYQLGF